MKEYCSALTKEDCRRQAGSYIACDKVRPSHFWYHCVKYLMTLEAFKLLPFILNIDSTPNQ